MDDEAFEAPCMQERCVNARENLQMLLRDTRQRANELNNYSKVQAEAETLRLKLASVDAILQDQTQRSIEAVNGKEIAEANYKQIQSDWEFLRRKVGLLEEKADDADRHKEQANHWRNKYDEMCCLAEKLEANNIDIKSKYEATVKTLGVVGKKTVSYQNQIAELKTSKSDAAQKAKKLDKYLKSAIQAIDSLAQSVNLTRQSKTVRDLVNVFRRDDVRLFFNAEPFKNSTSSGAEPSTSSQRIRNLDGEEEEHVDSPEDVTSSQPPQDDSMLLASGRRLSDSEEDEMGDEDGGDEDDVEVRKLESMVAKHVMKKSTEKPEFVSTVKELSARKGAPRMINSNSIKKWPTGIRKPDTVDSGGLLNPKRTHARKVPTCDFDAIADATEARKKALLGNTTTENTGPAPSGGTIHGKKGKTVREQQAEMMKESVKEKAARMKAEAATGGKTETRPAVPLRRTSSRRSTPPRTRLRSFMMSERGSDDSEDDEKAEEKGKKTTSKVNVVPQSPSTSEAPRRSGRPRSSSVHPGSRHDDDDESKTPRKRMQSASSSREPPPPPTPSRRSSRISSHVATEEVPDVVELEPPTARVLRSASRAASRASSRRPSPTPSTSSTREERARARSVLREAYDSDAPPSGLIAAAVRRSQSVKARRVMIDTDDEEEEELQVAAPKVVKKAPEESMEKTGDVLRRNLGLTARRRAAPAPIDVGAPTRTRGMGRMKAPVVVKKTSDDSKFGDISSSSNESAQIKFDNDIEFDDVQVFDRAPAGADPARPSTSKDSEAVEDSSKVEKPSEETVTVSDESSVYEDASEIFNKPENVAQKVQQPKVVRTLSEASSDSGDIRQSVEPTRSPKVTSEVPLTISIAEPSTAPTPEVADSTQKDATVKQTTSQPLLQARRQSGPPKSPQHQIMIDQLGLNLSDSESEGEEEEKKPTSSASISMEASGPLVVEEPVKASEVAPSAPEVAPSTPKDAPSAAESPKDVPSTPETAPSAPESAPPAPETAVAAPEAAPSAPESAPPAPETALAAPEVAPSARTDASSAAEAAPSARKDSSSAPEVAPAVPKAPLTNPKARPSAPKPPRSALRDAISAPKTAPSIPKAPSSAPKDAPSAPKDAPSAPKDAPSTPKDASSITKDALSAPKDAPSTSEVPPAAPEETPSASKTASSIPKAPLTNPKAPPSAPKEVPSAPKLSHQAPLTPKSTAAPRPPPQRLPLPTQTVSSESTSSSTSSNFRTPLNTHDDILADIISGAHMTKKTPVSKPPVIRGRKRAEADPSSSKIVKAEEAAAPPKRAAPSVRKEAAEDEMASILSGAKVTAPRVSTRRTPPTVAKTPSAKTEPTKPAAPKAQQEAAKPGPQKRPAPPTSSSSDNAGPVPKRQYTRKTPGVQVIDPIPLTRRRSSVRVALSRAASEEPQHPSSLPTTSSASESQQSVDGESATTSSVVKKPGPMKTMLIDVPSRPHGRAIRQEQKASAAVVKSERGGGKRVDKNKAHFRQALDLKVGLNELKRQMEDKGIAINDAIPLTPSDAVDVMMEFLRESSPADMWAVLMRQKLDGNVTPLVNTEEQNFLQVSASLITEDNELLELFIKRILYEISLRDSIDAKQCGRLVRLFCHTIKFVQFTPTEDSEDVEAILDAKRCAWMRSLFLLLLYQNPTQFPKAFAYCLISDMSAYCQLMVDELEKPATSSELNVAIRILMHKDQDQAAVINWLLNSKFELAIIPRMSQEDVQKACLVAHRQFVDEEVGGLKTSLFLAKTADPEILNVTFRVLRDHMALVNKQFLEPKEKDLELKHRTAYSVPTVAAKMSASEAYSFNRVVEWVKMMLLVMIDNPASTLYQPIMTALTEISSQIVSFREIIESSDIEQFVDSSGIESLREAVQHFLELTSDFTNFPLKPSTLDASGPSTSSK